MTHDASNEPLRSPLASKLSENFFGTQMAQRGQREGKGKRGGSGQRGANRMKGIKRTNIVSKNYFVFLRQFVRKMGQKVGDFDITFQKERIFF